EVLNGQRHYTTKYRIHQLTYCKQISNYRALSRIRVHSSHHRWVAKAQDRSQCRLPHDRTRSHNEPNHYATATDCSQPNTAQVCRTNLDYAVSVSFRESTVETSI